MRQFFIPLSCVLVLSACHDKVQKEENTQEAWEQITYPETKKENVEDTYFGEKVIDPYRWLEDDQSAETEAWVKAQNAVTFGYLHSIPFRDKIKAQAEKLWNHEQLTAPFRVGEYTYYYKNNGLQNQDVLYRKGKDGKEELFLDPNGFASDGTTSLAEVNFSKDGSLVCYLISEGGSDWRKAIVMNTQTREQVGDTIVNIKYSGGYWYKNEGFYYCSYDKPKGSELSEKTDQNKLYYHKLGTPQSSDALIFGGKPEEKNRFVGGYVSNDENYLIIRGEETTSGGKLWIKDLRKPNSPLVNILNDYSSDTFVLAIKGEKIYFQTNLNAPNGKIVVADLKDPTPTHWKDLIPETENVITPVVAGKYILAHYMVDAISQVKQYDFEGMFIREIKLPALGTVTLESAKEEENESYFSFENFYTPSSIYKDGTKVPMIITYKKGTPLDGTAPATLYGYGGFNISYTPWFAVTYAIWMNNGGVFAVANIRGGGEYGKKWHDAGTKFQKQNVFDDFIGACEYLIDNKYTSKEKLAIKGGSNGGLLIGAVMTQRPDLIRVALPYVGVMDMLRYHKFTSGAGWAYDYGTSDDSKEMFEYLKGYSPVHNVKEGTCYPATLIFTGDHDDRVVPAHSFKFAAQLQSKQSCKNPVFIRIETNAGHGAGTPVSKIIDQTADWQAFALWNMGYKKLPNEK